MNALNAGFGFTIIDGRKTLSLRQGKGDHVRIYPTGEDRGFGEMLTWRQVDLIRIATVVHVTDRRIRRSRDWNGFREPTVEVEVLDPAFWSRAETLSRLRGCVNFLSGGDDWTFRFKPSHKPCRDQQGQFRRSREGSPLVALYSGGLDSSAGLAARLAADRGRMAVPVTVRHQSQKANLVRKHFAMLVEHGLTTWDDLRPFQAGAFVHNRRIHREFRVRLREKQRCRPLLFMAVAGLVADALGAPTVEVFESGVGSVNLPLEDGPADHRTTRSTHPHFLRLVSALVSHVNAAGVEYALPFADQTKAEMVARLRELGLEELARESVSCVMDPRHRQGRPQCGYCPACVYRRQAMIAAGIAEAKDAYTVDLFGPPELHHPIAAKSLRCIQAFHQQVASLSELGEGGVPESLRRYLYATKAVASDGELAPHVEVHRRYRQEWLALIAAARRLGLPWITPTRSTALAGGAAP